MFIIYDGRESFYQWDLDRKLIVKDNTIKEVHFCNKTDDCSLVCETYTEDELNIVNVPNILLQDNWRINVYAYDSNYTKFSAVFDVVKRSKPADYIYTETEIKRYEEIEEKLQFHEEQINNLRKIDSQLLNMINNIEVSGGVQTDTTLSISGAPADAKTVGDKLKRTYNTLEITKATDLPDLDKAPLNTVVNINGCLQSIANIPNTDKVNATLFCFNGKPERQDTGYWTHTTQILSVYTYPYNENSNITYIRSCWGNVWMPWDLLLTDNNTVIPNYANFSAFKRFGTIGDSLSTGTYSNEAGETVEHLEKSWGTHIANKCDNQCLTLGFGGATTTRWIDGVSWHENNMTKALLPENECDAYIVCMGYNDNNVNTTSGGVELGSMADIDADNVDNNAVSYYGNMDKICRKLHSTFPKAKIFVLNNPFYNTNKAESYNIALKEVCDKLAGNSVYLIDMYSRYNKIYRKLAGDREGNHFHPQVYQYMGMLIATAISDYMRDNYTEFKYIENEHIVIKNDTVVSGGDGVANGTEQKWRLIKTIELEEEVAANAGMEFDTTGCKEIIARWICPKISNTTGFAMFKINGELTDNGGAFWNNKLCRTAAATDRSFRFEALGDSVVLSPLWIDGDTHAAWWNGEGMFNTIDTLQLVHYSGTYPIGLKIMIWGR